MAEYGLEAAANIPPNAMLPGWLDPFPSPFHTAVHHSGYGGIGINYPHLLNLWPSVYLFIVFLAVSYVLKSHLFPKLGVALGIAATNRSKQRKFANQLWLFCFYTCNSIFGWWAQRDKPWFALPPSFDNVRAMYHGYPAEPDHGMVMLFCTGLAFYASELVSLCFEARRKDFTQYVIHHVTTVILLVFSFTGHDHPMGAFVIFLHDVSDVFLTVAKTAHYINAQRLVNVNFVVFVVGFVFFRLVCLPLCLIGCFYISPVMRKATIDFYVRLVMLAFVIQLLHVYWFYLILRMAYRLITGVKGDSRSDSDNDDDCNNAPRKKKTTSSLNSKAQRSIGHYDCVNFSFVFVLESRHFSNHTSFFTLRSYPDSQTPKGVSE